jgi:lipid II:glycine glycyltransferase (peptidoglycan interpeptide bridge formation enzyme)
MIKIEWKRLIFNTAEIWFSDLFDVEGYSHVMFRRCWPQGNYSGFNFCGEEITSIIDLSQDLDTIWNNIEKDARRQIRRAQEAGVIVKRNQHFDEFYEIYRAHLSRKKYHVIPYDKLALMNAGILFTAELDGQVLLGAINAADRDHMLGRVGASRIIDNDKRLNTLKGNASRLLEWEVIKYAKEEGIKEYDIGGLFTDSLNSFKESLGGKRTIYHAYSKDYNMGYKLAASLGRQFYKLRHLDQ